MEILPYHDWVVVAPDEFTQTPGGIIVTAESMEDPDFMSKSGTVLAVGPGPLLESGERADPQCKPGDKVEFLSNVAKLVKVGDKKRYVVRDGNVMFRTG